jgi:hypothetical protein
MARFEECSYASTLTARCLAYTVLAGNPDWKSSLERPRRKWKGNFRNWDRVCGMYRTCSWRVINEAIL